jgi:hypothetical protein
LSMPLSPRQILAAEAVDEKNVTAAMNAAWRQNPTNMIPPYSPWSKASSDISYMTVAATGTTS